jgi:hypothetical protein
VRLTTLITYLASAPTVFAEFSFAGKNEKTNCIIPMILR